MMDANRAKDLPMNLVNFNTLKKRVQELETIRKLECDECPEIARLKGEIELLRARGKVIPELQAEAEDLESIIEGRGKVIDDLREQLAEAQFTIQKQFEEIARWMDRAKEE